MINQLAEDRVAQYLNLCPGGVNLKRYLGGGTDGCVWETSRDTAVKALLREVAYYNERDTYLRLEEWGLTEQIDGFWVPHLVGYNDELMVVEMALVQRPPYIIDFAKVRLDRPPDFSDEVMEYAEQQGSSSSSTTGPRSSRCWRSWRATRSTTSMPAAGTSPSRTCRSAVS